MSAGNVIELSRDWRQGLIVSEKGAIKKLEFNVRRVLSRHPAWQGVLAYNEFSLQIERLKPLPAIGPGLDDFEDSCGPWRDVDDTHTAQWLQAKVNLEVSVSMTRTSIPSAIQRRYHPVRDYLQGLQWDGKLRLASLMPRYFGTENSVYAQEIGRRFMIAAVARVMEPGCQVHTMPVLEGSQGGGKSTAIRILAGPWGSDTDLDLESKDRFQSLIGKWIVEFGELASLRNTDARVLKSFITSACDWFRAPYARLLENHPRQCVFVGTTNEGTYLVDKTGNRRFWPIRVGYIDLAALQADRDLLWAEAFASYTSKHPWHITQAETELLDQSKEQQMMRTTKEPWFEPVVAYLKHKVAADLHHDGFTAAQVLTGALSMPIDRIGPRETERLGRIMSSIKWTHTKKVVDGVRQWRYFAPILTPGWES